LAKNKAAVKKSPKKEEEFSLFPVPKKDRSSKPDALSALDDGVFKKNNDFKKNKEDGFSDLSGHVVSFGAGSSKVSVSGEKDDLPNVSLVPAKLSRSQDFRMRLRNSFGAIKQDMLALKEAQYAHAVKLGELKQSLKDSQTDYVTVDKLNVLKIRMSEVSETAKRLSSQLDKLENSGSGFVLLSEFRSEIDAIKQKQKKLADSVSEFEKSLASKDMVHSSIEDCNYSIEQLKEQLKEVKKTRDSASASEIFSLKKSLERQSGTVQDSIDEVRALIVSKVSAEEAEELISDINSEFDSVRSDIAKVSRQCDDLGSARDLRSDIEALDKRVLSLKSDMKSLAKIKQVENLIDDMNSQLDDVQDEFGVVHHEIKSAHKALASKKELSEASKKTDDAIHELRHMIKSNAEDLSEIKSEFKETLSDYATKSELKIEIDDLHAEVHEIAGSVQKLYEMKRKSADLDDIDKRLTYHVMDVREKYVERSDYNSLVDDFNRMKKVLGDAKTKKAVVAKASSSDLKASKRLPKAKVSLPKVDQEGKRMLGILGSSLIGVAFVLLILEIAFFYFNKFTSISTYLSIASVVFFVVGMGIRIYVTVTGKE
jgi:chromosome segregation ATPase